MEHLIKQLRVERSWSQQHLADLCGVGKRTIQRIESGRRPNDQTAMAIAIKLGVEANEITAWSETREIVMRVATREGPLHLTDAELAALPQDIARRFSRLLRRRARLEAHGQSVKEWVGLFLQTMTSVMAKYESTEAGGAGDQVQADANELAMYRELLLLMHDHLPVLLTAIAKHTARERELLLKALPLFARLREFEPGRGRSKKKAGANR